MVLTRINTRKTIILANNGERNFSECIVTGVSFDTLNISGINFYKAYLRDCTFSNGCVIAHANFEKTQIINSHFNGSYIDSTSFNESTLEEVTFDYSPITECSFYFTQINNSAFVGTDFFKSDFSGAKFNNTRLERVDLRTCNITDTAFHKCRKKSVKTTTFLDKFGRGR